MTEPGLQDWNPMQCKYLYTEHIRCHKDAAESLVFFNPLMDYYDIVLCEEHLQNYLDDQGMIE